MAIKTFNVDQEVYKIFSTHCKNNGINMSKQVELFMRTFIEEDPKARDEYLKKLDKIRKGKFMKVDNFSTRYGM